MKERIVGFDVARALAYFGMVVVHFSLVLSHDKSTPLWAATILRALDGRATAAFVLLAGLGIALRTQSIFSNGQPSIVGLRRATVRRGLVLLACGLINLVIWPGDILRVYGVSMIVAAFLLEASNGRLLWMSATFVLGFLAMFLSVEYGDHWDWDALSYRQLWTPTGLFRHLFYDGFRSVFPWTALLLLGMWLGRLDWMNPTFISRRLLIAVVVAACAEGGSMVAEALAASAGLDAVSAHYLWGTESMPPLPIFLVAASSEGLAAICVCVAVTQRYPQAFVTRCLAATGRLAFTWYVLHILVGLGGIVVLGLEGSQTLPMAMAAGIGFFVPSVVVSTLYLRRFDYGPLESLLRKVAG